MRLARETLVLAAVAAACAGPGSGDARAAQPHVTMITDSVAGVLLSTPAALQTLGQGLDLQIFSQPCRKLVDPGCPAPNSDTPPSALATIRDFGTQLGPEVVMEVGYNDFYDAFADGFDEVMGALVDAGVQHVVWVTLVENQGTWAQINQVIRAGPARWPQLTVADWAPVAAGQPWFVDNAHMNYEGAVAFATFLRPYVVAACGAPCASPPPAPTPKPVFCGFARTVNGFDPVRVVKGVSCPRARSAVAEVEHGAPGPWACSRAVHAAYELDCRTSGAEIQVLERSPVPAVRHGSVVTLANWSFRLRDETLEGRTATLGWRALIERPPYCVPAVPREALVALGLRRTTPSGGCFAPR